MPEDAGKKKYIKDFIQQVKSGEGLIEDIWIERSVRLPGSDGQGSTARSLSGNSISNITELLEDDLKHTFKDGYFTFRFVAALVGSGKTSLLTYLEELTKTQPTYQNLSVIVRFQLSDLLNIGGNSSYSIKLYCHILAYTFWELLHNPSLCISVKDKAEEILSDLLENDRVSKLKGANKFKIQFYPRFTKYLSESEVSLEDFFLYLIQEISEVNSQFTFVYLVDELDALQQYPQEIQETRSLFKALIKGIYQQFQSKIRLLIYLVGTSNNITSFISGDSVLESLVEGQLIELNKGYRKEFEMIQDRINHRIKSAFSGYKYFNQAWHEVENISVNPSVYSGNLRSFCKEYAEEMLRIHEKYFREAPEQVFEGNARQILEDKCQQHWSSFLRKSTYKLSESSTTTIIENHAFDCYVELQHNEECVARAFGEAKNYELLSSHLKTFKQWLDDAKFKAFTSNEHPSDLAFMIAPSCPSLLKRKLELANIQFIESDKVTTSLQNSEKASPLLSTEDRENEDNQQDNNQSSNTGVNINTASKPEIIDAFKGTGIRGKTIDTLLKRRNNKPYKDLDHLVSNFKWSNKVKDKLQEKLNNGDICF